MKRGSGVWLWGAVAAALFILSAGMPGERQALAQPAVLECGDFWTRSPVPGLGDGGRFPCIEYDPRNPAMIVGPRHPYRIFYTASWARSPHPQSAAFLRTIAEAFDRSVRHFRRLGLTVGPINILVSQQLADDPSGDPFNIGMEIGFERVLAGEPCPVISYAVALGIFRDEGADKIKQAVSHEIFHCIQFSVFAGSVDWAEMPWLVEGTAEYFSHAVYGCVNGEHAWSTSFDPDKDILSQDDGYEDVVFFQHLATRGGMGEAGILSLIRAMPPNGGSYEQQRAALAGIGGMSAKFHEFAKDYLDNDVPDCRRSGGRMPVSRNPGPLERVDDATVVELDVSPFTIGRKQVELASGKNYIIVVRNPRGRGRISWRNHENTDSWQEIPGEFTTSCDGPSTFQIAATTINAGNFRAQIRFTPTDDGPECPAARSCRQIILNAEETRKLGKATCGNRSLALPACLAGNWQIDVAYWRKTLENMLPKGTVVIHAANDTVLSISDDGAVNACINSEVKTSRPGKISVETQTTISGASMSKIGLSSPTTLCSKIIREEIEAHAVATIGGVRSEQEIKIGPVIPPDSRFKCSGNELFITTPTKGGPAVTSRYLRKR